MPAATLSFSWTADPALLWVALAAALWWLGGGSAVGPRSASRGLRKAAFFSGLAAIVVAVASPIDGWADQLQWAHMLQHVLLLLVAPPLLALAQPWNRMWHGLPLGLRRRVAREVTRGRFSGQLRSTARFLGDPVPSWMLFTVTLVAWHLPFAYDATLRTPLVHAVEHALFFGTGLLFWTRVIDSPPWRSPLGETARAVYVASAMVASWMLAVVLALASAPLYAPYAAEASRPGGITALADQQLAAGVMWVPGSIPFTIAILFVVYRWLEGKPPRRPAPRTHPLAGNP